MRIDPLLKIIKENKNSYEKLGIPVIYTDILEPEHQGQEITLTILKNKYKVGYLYVTEDHDDWAQAECYQVDWCQENEKEIPTEKLITLLNNLQQHLRDNKLNNILK